MMKGIHRHINPNVTQQTEAARADQIENNAGGFVFRIDLFQALERFLILGTDGGTYYADERKHTKQAFESVKAALRVDYERAIAQITECSLEGRAPKNDPALLALAYASGITQADHPHWQEVRRVALMQLHNVARTATHLFHFLEYVQMFRGWGRGLKNAVANWYDSTPERKLAYQMVKYRQRDGWTHRDVLRLSHLKSDTMARQALYQWATKAEITEYVPAIVRQFQFVQNPETPVREIVKLLSTGQLPWESVPSHLLTHPQVWKALLPHLPYTALVRNLGRITNLGLLEPLSDNEILVSEKLTHFDTLRKARAHPLMLLNAYKTYTSGKGLKGNLSWVPNQTVSAALRDAFHMSFHHVEPSGKRMYLAIDVSGSMAWGNIAGTAITPMEAATVMAMVTHRIEPSTYIAAFSDDMQKVNLQKKDNLEAAERQLTSLRMGWTDCAAPILDAMRRKMQVDAFVVYTDIDTWCGRIHPFQALKQYRQSSGINAKLIVCGMTATEFSIADPSDPGMLDVVGFSTTTPAAISAFVAN